MGSTLEQLLAQESAFSRSIEAFDAPRKKHDLDREGYLVNLQKTKAAIVGLKEAEVISLGEFRTMVVEQARSQSALKEHDKCRPTWNQNALSDYIRLKAGLTSIRKQIEEMKQINPTRDADVINFPLRTTT
jgi:hypothetical protein